MKVYIRVLSGLASKREILLDQPVVTCGRHHENDLTLTDNDTSRYHCRFVLLSGSKYLVEDAGSSNGTYVNDILVRYKVLAEGDQIRIGSTLLEIVTAEEGSLCQDDSVDPFGDFNFEADLVPEVGTAKPILDSAVECYSEVANEQTILELPTELDFVYRATSIASTNLTLQSLCQNLVKLVVDWVGGGQALLVLLDENEQDFSQSFTWQGPAEGSSSDQSAQLQKVKFNRGLVDRVLVSRLPSAISFDVSSERSQEVTAMCVPIDNGKKLLGLIYVDNWQSLNEQTAVAFSGQGLNCFAAMGKQAAAAIENNTFLRTALIAARENAVEKSTSVFSHRINNLLHVISGGEFLIEAGLQSNDLQRVAEGWKMVRRSQNRIGQLSTNMALQCRELVPLIRKAEPHSIINFIVEELGADFGETRLKVVHHTALDLSLGLDSHYFDRAIRNFLAVGLWAAEDGQDGQDVVMLETMLSDDWFVMRVQFRHFDDRFDLARLGKDELNSVNAELGFLEMLVSQKIVVSHSGSLACSTDTENLNTIEVRLPLVSSS